MRQQMFMNVFPTNIQYLTDNLRGRNGFKSALLQAVE
jgi:hypothetical protein